MRNKYKRHFLDTWKKYKDIFIKPKFKWYFGTWRHESNLPVWRRGPQIRFGKYGEIDEKWNWAKLESAEWNELGKRNHPILSKIIKKPVWQLPIWLAFHWYNDDIMYKTKWDEDDFTFEFPTRITLVFFGLALSVTAYIPKIDNVFSNDDYWESMLAYQYYNGDLNKVNNCCGWYNNPGEKNFRFVFNPKFLKRQEDRDKLESIQISMLPELIRNHEKEEKERLENRIYGVYCGVSHKEEKDEGGFIVFDGWYATTFNKQFLVYLNEEDCDNVINNLKEVEVKIKGMPTKIEYKKYIGDRRYYFNWKTKELYKSAIIDKNIDITKNIFINNND